jgi:hypothetical protein
MAKVTVEVLVDDLDGSEGAETVRLGWNGDWREIDLSKRNRASLSKALDKYWNAGRPVGGDRQWTARAYAIARSCGQVSAGGRTMDAHAPRRPGRRTGPGGHAILRNPAAERRGRRARPRARRRRAGRTRLPRRCAGRASARRLPATDRRAHRPARRGGSPRPRRAVGQRASRARRPRRPTRAAIGLGGRSRSFPADDERARSGVTKAIRRALDEITAASPALGAHFRETIVTGLSCRYTGSFAGRSPRTPAPCESMESGQSRRPGPLRQRAAARDAALAWANC